MMVAIFDPPARAYRTDSATRAIAKARRDALLDGGWCINGQAHGKATHGVRCKRCDDVHKGGLPPPRVTLTHCTRGHEFTPENTTYTADSRVCRTCHRVLAWCRRRAMDSSEIARVFAALPNHTNAR